MKDNMLTIKQKYAGWGRRRLGRQRVGLILLKSFISRKPSAYCKFRNIKTHKFNNNVLKWFSWVYIGQIKTRRCLLSGPHKLAKGVVSFLHQGACHHNHNHIMMQCVWNRYFAITSLEREQCLSVLSVLSESGILFPRVGVLPKGRRTSREGREAQLF